MAKLTLALIAVFLIFQLVASADIREKRDAETSTSNILDSIKTGIESTFSEQNIKKVVDNLNDFGDKAKNLGTNIFDNIKNALKPDTPSTP